ncbi:MAG: hypothetical protein M3Q58_09240 [Bacteroidota bacterium]|nr:hypothetical protein [Bacteroidota bacterium]
MKNSIKLKLPKHTVIESESKNIYIVDYANLNNGPVVLLDTEPQEVNYVFIRNDNKVSVCFDGFEKNALVINAGNHSLQCECVLFPSTCDDSDWVLFIETKYTNDIKSAFKEENNYPKCMIDQIVDTVSFFRKNGILKEKRRATAIVSFPNLIEEFNSTFFSGEITELDILKAHNILIRATNSAKIISQKRIKLYAH